MKGFSVIFVLTCVVLLGQGTDHDIEKYFSRFINKNATKISGSVIQENISAEDSDEDEWNTKSAESDIQDFELSKQSFQTDESWIQDSAKNSNSQRGIPFYKRAFRNFLNILSLSSLNESRPGNDFVVADDSLTESQWTEVQFIKEKRNTSAEVFRCPTEKGNFPNVEDCSKYWRCTDGIAYGASCGNQYFNPETLHCEEKSYVSCSAYEFKKKVICYFDNQNMDPNFTPEKLSPYLCTHIHYSYARLYYSRNSYSIASSNRRNDIFKRYYQRVIDLKKKNPKLKVLLSLKLTKNNGSTEYYDLVSEETLWSSFVESVITYLQTYKFDGLELNFGFPICRTTDECDPEPSKIESKQELQAFLETLKAKLSEKNLLLSVRVPGSKLRFEKAYKMKDLGNVADYVIVMAYLIPGEKQSTAVPPSVLYSQENKQKQSEHLSCSDSGGGCKVFPYLFSSISVKVVNNTYSKTYLLRPSRDTSRSDDMASIMSSWAKEISPSKLILGVRADARLYELQNESETKMYSPITGTPKDIAYHEVCSYMKSGNWQTGNSSQVADYVHQNTTWIGFQSPENMNIIAEFAARSSYAGVALIENVSDDFEGRCCRVKNPLLKGLVYGFAKTGLAPRDFGCS